MLALRRSARSHFCVLTYLCNLLIFGDFAVSASLIQLSEDNFMGCINKDIKVPRSSQYVFITSPNSTGCQWSVSLEDSDYTRHNLELEILEWQPSSAKFMKLSVYDGLTGDLLASYDKNSGARTKVGTHVYSFSGHFLITYQTSSYREAYFRAAVKLPGVCVEGTKSCGDGANCYKTTEMCDRAIQCPNAFDELGCGGCEANQFWCGEDDDTGHPPCYTASQRCNGQRECPRQSKSDDEKECHICGPGAVLCKSGDRCIFERWICDQDADCDDRSDEEGCTYPASRRVITAAIVGALVCSLLLVISLGCTCKLYSLRTAHNRRSILHTTPLTRVEREIFARQAPPTYDMTVSGVDSDALNTRQQRNRRRRSRRYPFQRSAPARSETQVVTNREEGVQQSSSQQQQQPSSNQTENRNVAASESSSASENNVQSRRQNRSSTLQSLGSFLFESMRSSIPTPLGTSASSRPSTGQNAGSTQAGANENRSQQGSSTQSRASSRSGSRRSRSSSRGRSSRTSNSDQQAKPLPKKKRILPVRVPAPCEDGAVEEDVLACVYPTPPSYSQAVLSDEVQSSKQCNGTADSDAETAVSQNNREESVDGATAININLTTQTKSRFSFSFSRMWQKLAASSFLKFRQNPYLQMTSQDSRRSSQQESVDAHSAAENGHSSALPVQTRGSTSSDDDLLDCSLNSSPRHEEMNDLLSSQVVSSTQDAQVSNTKIFPQRRLGNLSSSRMKDEDCDSIHMFDLSMGERM